MDIPSNFWQKQDPGKTVQESVVPKEKQYRLVLVDTWWYWVSTKRYWLIYDGPGSVCGSTCWYLVALDQYKAVMVDP